MPFLVSLANQSGQKTLFTYEAYSKIVYGFASGWDHKIFSCSWYFFFIYFLCSELPPPHPTPEVIFMIKKYMTKHTIKSLYLTLELKIIIVPSVKRLSETNAQDIFPIK